VPWRRADVLREVQKQWKASTLAPCTCRASLCLSDKEQVRRLTSAGTTARFICACRAAETRDFLRERQRGRQNHAEAVRLSRLATDQGLGICYEYGPGVNQDHAGSVRLYRLAADQGLTHAQNGLGICSEHSTVVDHDSTEAVWLYRLSVSQGHANAQHSLGRLQL
jgi:TPR repeat protein